MTHAIKTIAPLRGSVPERAGVRVLYKIIDPNYTVKLKD
jgi:hypothetical protein